MMPTIDVLKEQINCVLGRKPCELRLINARLVDVLSGKILDGAEIFINDGKIIDAGLSCRAIAEKRLILKGHLLHRVLSMRTCTLNPECFLRFSLQD